MPARVLYEGQSDVPGRGSSKILHRALFLQTSLQAKSGSENVFRPQHLGCRGQHTSRIHKQEVDAALYLQVRGPPIMLTPCPYVPINPLQVRGLRIRTRWSGRSLTGGICR